MRIVAFFFLFLVGVVCYSQDIHLLAKTGDIISLGQMDIKESTVYNQVNDSGYTPLILAAYYNQTDMIAYLLANGANIDTTSPYGTALMAAVVKGHLTAIQLLLDNNADSNISDENGSNALHYAVIFKRIDVAQLLLEGGANTTLKDNRGNRPLDYAIMNKNEPLIKLISQYQ